MTPEKQIRRDIAQNLIESCETLLSAQAWKFFQTLGRGYLYLHKVVNIEHSGGNNFSIAEGVSVIGNKVHYVAKGTQAWNMAKLSQAAQQQSIEYAQLFALIETYDPRNEFVAIVGFNYGTDATEHWFNRRPAIPPIQAFTVVQNRPQEFGVELF